MRLAEIIEKMQQAAEQTENIKELHFDLSDDGVLNYWNNTPNIQYPSLVAEIGDTFQTIEDTATMQYNFRLFIGDRRMESHNNDWRYWDTLALDVLAFVQRLNNLFTDGTRASESLIFTPTTQVFSDNLAVVSTTLTIETPVNINACEYYD